MKFIFYNRNPLNKVEEDCVIKAISTALDKDYYIVQEKLYAIAQLYECEALCECCYRYLLEQYYDLERIEDYQGCTVKEFADENPTGIYLIRVDGHLTCVIDCVNYDLWDCSNEIVDIIWRVD